MGILPRKKKKSLGKRKGEEGYGQGKAAISFGDDVLLDEEAMVEKLLACLEAPDYRPPTLPSVAMELMELARRPEVEIDDVVALVEKDTLIAGRILKLVQSPMYAGVARIESLADEVVLGPDQRHAPRQRHAIAKLALHPDIELEVEKLLDFGQVAQPGAQDPNPCRLGPQRCPQAL